VLPICLRFAHDRDDHATDAPGQRQRYATVAGWLPYARHSYLQAAAATPVTAKLRLRADTRARCVPYRSSPLPRTPGFLRQVRAHVRMQRTGLRCTNIHRFRVAAIFYPNFYPNRHRREVKRPYLPVTATNWRDRPKYVTSLPSWSCGFDSRRPLQAIESFQFYVPAFPRSQSSTGPSARRLRLTNRSRQRILAPCTSSCFCRDLACRLS
jgi:hypothetical protein